MKNKDFPPFHIFPRIPKLLTVANVCVSSQNSPGFFFCFFFFSDSQTMQTMACHLSLWSLFCVMTLITGQRQKVNQIEYSCPLFPSFHSSPSLLLFALPRCGCKRDYLGGGLCGTCPSLALSQTKPFSEHFGVLTKVLAASRHVKIILILKKDELNKQSPSIR